MPPLVAKLLVLLGVGVFVGHWLIYLCTLMYCLVARPDEPDAGRGAIHSKMILGHVRFLNRRDILVLGKRGVLTAIGFLLLSALVASIYGPF